MGSSGAITEDGGFRKISGCGRGVVAQLFGVFQIIAADADNLAGRGGRQEYYFVEGPGFSGPLARCVQFAVNFMDVMAFDDSGARARM